MHLADAADVVLGNVPLPCGDRVPFFDGDFHGAIILPSQRGRAVLQSMGWSVMKSGCVDVEVVMIEVGVAWESAQFVPISSRVAVS